MVGQQKLMAKLETLSLATLPKSLLLIGEYGCGKHTFASLIAKKVGIPIQDISHSLTLETINEMRLSVNPILYLINNNDITLKEEGVLLNILEEPSNNVFIIILCESKTSVLETIVNRCQSWEFEAYSKQELFNFSQDEFILSFANTPGKIKRFSSQPISAELDFCNTLLIYTKTANLASIIASTNLIGFKEEPDKYNYWVIIELLDYCAFNKYKQGEISKKVFDLTHTLLNDSKIKNINTKYLFENYLCNLKLQGGQ